MVSKALVVGAYHGKLAALARHPGLDLLAVIPPSWLERGRAQVAEPVTPVGYAIRYTPLWLNGHYHLHVYPRLGRIVRAFRPDLIHIDEEPYNAATAQACWLARRHRARAVFFAWQNLPRAYPPPFRWFERYVFAQAAGIAGTHSAKSVLQLKGFRGPCVVIPQFGIDRHVYAPIERSRPSGPFRVGYAGRLVPEKGVDRLIRAVEELDGDVELLVAGAGLAEQELRRLVAGRAQVRFLGALPSHGMPGFYRNLDVFVQPTVGRTGWTEQFGRAAIEAMASGVPTIVSDAGELPALVGDAALIVPAGDVVALRDAISTLRDAPERHRDLGTAGRAHVLHRYTHEEIAARTAAFYHQVVHAAGP